METKNFTTFPTQTVGEYNITCPQCGENAVTTTTCPHVFSYGSGKDAVDLEVRVPARHCQSCDFGFLDSEAEELKHNAVCQHLGVLTPSDIKHIRKSHAMSRDVFAKTTGFGAASLGRWENGITIQNLSNDRFLRLLRNPRIMRHLESLVTSPDAPVATCNNNVVPFRFRKIKVSEDMLHKQKSFQLRLAN